MSWVDPDEEMRVMKDTQMKDSTKDEKIDNPLQRVHGQAEAIQLDAKDASLETVTSITREEREKVKCRMRKPTAFKMLKNLIGKIVFHLKDGILWQYEEYWEETNEEIYKSGDYDNESEFIIEQKMINARDIDMGDSSINENYYPWHGYTFQEFKELNDEMQSTLDIVRNIKNKKGIKRFRRAHKRIYNAYYMTPICVYLDDNGRIMFGGDGRHRIHAASITNGLIPVWIIKYKDPKTVNMEYFKTNYANGQWRFLKTI